MSLWQINNIYHSVFHSSQGRMFAPAEIHFLWCIFTLVCQTVCLSTKETIRLACQGVMWVFIILGKSQNSTVPWKYKCFFVEILDQKLFLKIKLPCHKMKGKRKIDSRKSYPFSAILSVMFLTLCKRNAHLMNHSQKLVKIPYGSNFLFLICLNISLYERELIFIQSN